MPQTVSTTQRDSLDLSERHVNGRPAISNPVDDPEAALQFCLRLHEVGFSERAILALTLEFGDLITKDRQVGFPAVTRPTTCRTCTTGCRPSCGRPG